MSGPRDPSEFEAGMYRDAIERRDAAGLRAIMGAYPNIMFGSVTSKLSDEDRKWVMESLTPEPVDDWGESWRIPGGP